MQQAKVVNTLCRCASAYANAADVAYTQAPRAERDANQRVANNKAPHLVYRFKPLVRGIPGF